MKEKQFLKENDDVRKYDTEYNSLRCCIEQENQMIDKMHRRYRIYQQEKAFDDVNQKYLMEQEAKKQKIKNYQKNLNAFINKNNNRIKDLNENNNNNNNDDNKIIHLGKRTELYSSQKNKIF